MDKEEREALEMSREDLLDKAAKGRPARMASKEPRRPRRKRKDINQLAASVVSEATKEHREVSGLVVQRSDSIRIESSRLLDLRPIKIKGTTPLATQS